MEYKGIVLDKFQEDAIAAVEQNQSVVVSAPTGSGKTLIADYIIDRDIKKGVRVIYTAPIKALSNQKYKDFCKQYGEDKIGLLTGDVVKNPTACVLIMTTEIYRNMAIVKDVTLEKVSYVIFDEIHYINDPERGYVWEESIIFSPDSIRMLCLSATIPNAEEFRSWIAAIKTHSVILVTHDQRSVPLQISFFDYALGITSLKELQEAMDIPSYESALGYRYRPKEKHPSASHVALVKELGDKTPCLFFCFSRSGCQKKSRETATHKIFSQNPVITTQIRRHLSNSPQEINSLESTQILRQTLPLGIGFHHAGLLPVMKELVEDLFSQGLIKVLYTTETFAVGINMPAKTTCFESLRKFDGHQFRLLHSKEFFQIAGRAGRRGIDAQGYAIAMIDRREFDVHSIKRIISKDIDPIRSQFHLSTNTVLNLIHRHSPSDIDNILRKSFFTFQKFSHATTTGHGLQTSFEKKKRELERMEYVKQGSLTPKGVFCSSIFSDEILISEVFATEVHTLLNPRQVLCFIGCICFEGRDTDEKPPPTAEEKELLRLIHTNPVLKYEKRLVNIPSAGQLISPCYEESSIFEIFSKTTLLEGDVIRFLRQVLDRLRQIETATTDYKLASLMRHLQAKVKNTLAPVE